MIKYQVFLTMMVVLWLSPNLVQAEVRDDIQKEIDGNPFLKKERIQLKVIEATNGYITIEMLGGDRMVREKINKGIDIFSNQFEMGWSNYLAFVSVSQAERNTVAILRRTLAYIQGMKGVKQTILTAAVNTPLDRALDFYDKKQYSEAVEWFQKAAEQGEATAQNYLGFMYDNGQGVPKDYAKAVEWYQKAAEQGEANAQINLGLIYYNGQGVPKDYAKAVEWFQKAAEQGNAIAQGRLGLMYANGQGVPKDYTKAVEWYQKAAEQNNIEASNALAWFYAICEDGNFRNGPKAVEYALKATKSVKTDCWYLFDTLAAAYARNDEFDKAIEAAQRSIELLVKDATVENKEKWLQEMKDRLELYRKHEPYVHHPNKEDEETAK